MFELIILLLLSVEFGVFAENAACDQMDLRYLFDRLNTFDVETNDQIRNLRESVTAADSTLSTNIDDTNRRIDRLYATVDYIKTTIENINRVLEIDECASRPCMNGAICVDGINRYSCKCIAGYNGTNCQIDIDECESRPCLNGATCVDGINSYSCKCLAGYNGTNCQNEIDECESSPCLNGATCINGINNYSCTCIAGYNGTNCQIEQYDCAGYRKEGVTKSGVYTVTLWKTKSKIQVFCDMTTDGGGWTVFQNRFDGSVDFYQNFASYENGFGNLSGEFWLGLKYIQEMTLVSQTELRVDLRAADGSTAYEVFQNFRLTEGPDYKLNIDPGTGTAGDSAATGLSFNNDSRFSTFDRDADNSRYNDCARNCHGGWWYSECCYVNLNGHYAEPGTSSSYTQGWGGMIYSPFKQTKSLKSSKMMLRRVT